jgi:hypothetical protein
MNWEKEIVWFLYFNAGALLTRLIMHFFGWTK